MRQPDEDPMPSRTPNDPPWRVEDVARAERIRACMKQRGWGFQRLADEVGVSKAAVEKWIYAKKKPTWPHLARLAEVFETTPRWLETGRDGNAVPADPVQTLRHDFDQVRGRLAHMGEEIRFIAANRDAINRLEESVAEIRALLVEQGVALGELLQRLATEQLQAEADRRSGEARTPVDGERRESSGRRRSDP